MREPASENPDPRSADGIAFTQERQSPARLVWKRFRGHRAAVVSLIVLGGIGLAVALAGLIAPYPYTELHLQDQLSRPSSRFLFGTDTLGRDQLSRLLYGGRISLAVGIAVAGFSTVIGALVGAVAGYYGGRLDNVLMRLTDLLLSIPLLIILILTARILGGSIFDIVLVLSLFFWMPLARIVRGVFLSLKEKEFVEAARALGASDARVIIRHMLPNTAGPIIVNATLSVAGAILTESVLSFLGFGIQPPTPTWGNMLFQGKGFTTTAPWLVWFPGLAILVTVLAVNYLGDGLRDAFDPRQQRVRA
jgi:peptide/nickel transport system permease protein